jgi:DNA-binding CsgD family transcriptional regulator
MVKKIRHPENNQELIKSLLRQRAAERASSRRWNQYSLLVISAVLIAVIILQARQISLYVTGGVALAGLCIFWFFTFVQGRRLEQKLYEQETADYQNLSSGGLTPPAAGARGGESPLSTRELEVLRCIVQGCTNKEIARKMYISEQTAKNHITHILKKMNVTDRTAAAVMALRLGLIKTGAGGQTEIAVNPEDRPERHSLT